MSQNLRSTFVLAAVFIAGVLIWRLAVLVSETMPEVSWRLDHLVFATFVCTATIGLVALAVWGTSKDAGWLGLQGGTKAFRAFATGVLCFFIPAAATLAVCLVSGIISISVSVPASSFVLSFAAAAVLVLLAEAIPEELLFRGYFWAYLSERTVTWIVIGVQAILFVTLAGMIGAVNNVMDVSFLAWFALVLGMLRSATQSLYAPVGFHLAFMATQQALGPGWNLVVVDQPELLQMVMAIIPFSVTITYLINKIAWGEKQGQV